MKEFWNRRLDPAQKYGLRLTLFTLALILVAVPFGLLLREVTSAGPFTEVDTAAANHLHEYVRGSPALVDLLQVISFLGGPPWLYALLGGTALWLLSKGRKRSALFVTLTPLLGGFIDTVVKVLVARPRPSLVAPVATAHGQSFPSGHAMTSLVGYGALVLVLLPVIARRRRLLAIAGAATLVVAVGFSRLALGVHYISDVLGGYALGASWLAASTAAFGIWREETLRPVPQPDLHPGGPAPP